MCAENLKAIINGDFMRKKSCQHQDLNLQPGDLCLLAVAVPSFCYLASFCLTPYGP